ncbi:selenophosphate synthase [Alkaliphilus peptidifermentans DSM 18978]|uniref:Selenophosphate synthase n=1 Tax=Alkaliphilus peptidifermentans DSM 18978 TaxID=1120976 RepID=A0A1G5J6W6_9FIRM|nr:selenophosphate synthase [Alkaliphilus peptidifermentans DSM 18978]
MIQTLDFFTPVVDDPYTYGQIAAANALSDVYAMGGEPLTAMNIVCFPSCLSIETMREILRGGADKVKEAGAILAGGHSVEDDEPKYGLSITGTVHPEKVWANGNAKVGDVLILTKPIGLGILNTAIKADISTQEQYDDAVKTMIALNKYSKRAVEGLRVSACTDITGFGFLGHTYEVAKASNVSIEIFSDEIPILEGAKELAGMGIIPAGMYSNKKYLDGKVSYVNRIEEVIDDILYDPQTSGGLLVAINPLDLERALKALEKYSINPYAVVGTVVDKGEYPIYIK